jgi:hypothetical protein
MSHLINWPVKGRCDWCLSVWGPYPPPLTHCAVYVYKVYFFTQESGGELNQREGERGNRGEYRSQSWVENTNMTECTQEISSLYSDNTRRKVPLQVYFLDDDFLHWLLWVLSFLRVQGSNFGSAEQQEWGISSAFPVTRMTDTKTKRKKRANKLSSIGIQRWPLL